VCEKIVKILNKKTVGKRGDRARDGWGGGIKNDVGEKMGGQLLVKVMI